MTAGANTGTAHPGKELAAWRQRLRNATRTAGVFSTAELDGLEGPVRGYLAQAIAPDTSLAQCAQITMRGSIKVGRWLPFRARQVLRPRDGFIWVARIAGVITGSDRYLHGVGSMDWKLAGLINLSHADGPDLSRSAAGRGGAEAVWLPTALLPRFGVRWSVQSPRELTAYYLIGDTPIEAQYRLGAAGDVASVIFDRWGDPDNSGQWDWHRFGGIFTQHRTFAGLSIPSVGRLGWHYGTERFESGEFFRYQITDVRLLEPDGGRIR